MSRKQTAWTFIAPLLGVAALCALVWWRFDYVSTRRIAEEKAYMARAAVASLNMLSTRLKLDHPPYLGMDKNGQTASWRRLVADVSPSLLFYQPEEEETWPELQAEQARWEFCFLEDWQSDSESEPPTRLMAIQDADSPYQHMIERGYWDVAEMAPHAIVLVEVVNCTIPWDQPGDLVLADIPQQINPAPELGIGSADELGFVVAFVDGSVWVLDPSVDFEAVHKLLTVEGVKQHDRENLLGEFANLRLPPFGSEVD